MPKKEQIERANKINELIEVIGNTDRKFFSYTDENGKTNFGKFEFGKKKLFYIDGYTKKRIYPYPCAADNINFCGGGALWGLVNDFRIWIITGEYSNGKNGNNGLYATTWGYSIDGMDKVIQKAKEIGYIKAERPSFREYCTRMKANGNSWMLSNKIIEELKAS